MKQVLIPVELQKAIESLEAIGYQVVAPGEVVSDEQSEEILALVGEFYKRGEELEFDFNIARPFFEKHRHIYRQAFELLDFDQLVSTWSEDSLRKVAFGGKIIQIVPGGVSKKPFQRAAARRFRELTGPAAVPSGHGMGDR